MRIVSITLTDEFQQALNTAKAMVSCRRLGNALFITGRAGTGKSTLIKLLSDRIKDSVVMAPTGVAATLAGGSTIHRVFHFPFKIIEPALDREKSYPSPILAKAKAMIVDEAGMVRADLVDGMDYYLRRANRRVTPFAGIPMIFVGDPYQIPPVLRTEEQESYAALGYSNRHFFGAKVWQEFGLNTVELTHIFRQENKQFAAILSRVRSGEVTEDDLATLNARVGKPSLDTATHTPYRRRAEEINNAALAHLSSREEVYTARITGDFGDGDTIAEKRLVVKKGALVMLLNNTDEWSNGTTGTYEGMDKGQMRVKLASGQSVSVGPHKWERCRYKWDSVKGAIDQVKLGEMAQYPVKVAYAVTIHKGQGQTLDRCHVDFGRGMFESGQAYVALSRVRTLDGLSLSRPLEKADCIVDPHVKNFFDQGCTPTMRQPAQVEQVEQLAAVQRRQLALFA